MPWFSKNILIILEGEQTSSSHINNEIKMHWLDESFGTNLEQFDSRVPASFCKSKNAFTVDLHYLHDSVDEAIHHFVLSVTTPITQNHHEWVEGPQNFLK